VQNSKKRPPGLGVIAVILTLLAISGFLNAFVWPGLSASLPRDAPLQLRAGVNAPASPAVSHLRSSMALRRFAPPWGCGE
jgi:hypothetical protein